MRAVIDFLSVFPFLPQKNILGVYFLSRMLLLIERAIGIPQVAANSERRKQLAETADRAFDFGALHRAPDHDVHPGDDGRVEVAFQWVDAVHAAPTAARDVDAVRPFRRLLKSVSRRVIFHG